MLKHRKQRNPPCARRNLLLLDDALPQYVEGVAVGDVDEAPAGVAAVLPRVRQSLGPLPLDHEALAHAAAVPLVPPPAPALADVAVLLNRRSLSSTTFELSHVNGGTDFPQRYIFPFKRLRESHLMASSYHQ